MYDPHPAEAFAPPSRLHLSGDLVMINLMKSTIWGRQNLEGKTPGLFQQRLLRFLGLLGVLTWVGLMALATANAEGSGQETPDAKAKLSSAPTTSEASKKSSEIPARRDFPVDESVSPCVDFYQYACNQVRDRFELRPDRSRHTFAFNDSDERILEFKKGYFKSLQKEGASSTQGGSKATGASLPSREEALRSYYLGCMNAPAREVEERARVAQIKAELAKLSSHEQLQKYLSKNILLPEFSVVGFGAIPNQDHSEFNDLYFSLAMQSLPERSYYAKPEVTGELEKVIQKFFESIGEPQAAEKAKKIVAFETELAQILPLPAEIREIVSSRTSITREQLLKQFPRLGLSELLARVPTSVKFRHFYPRAMEWVEDRLQSTPLEDWKALILYHSLAGEMDDAYPDFFKERFEFRHRRLGGPLKRPDREERCTRSVMGTFAHELDSVLWPQYFQKFDRKKAVRVAEKVRSTLLAELQENRWLSEGARKEAIRKIKKSQLQLVAPQTEREWDFLPSAKYSTTEPLANGRRVSWLHSEKTLSELGKPLPKERWGMGPMTVNAYFSPSYNKFVLPVGILQYPFFDAKLSMEANLGAMGAVVGHELGHAVDDQGAKYDADGQLRDWMTAEDHVAFKKRTESLVTQFNQVGHNGQLTLGENIGDLVGISTAYRAAFGSSPKSRGGQTLKAQREFFLGWARVWCSVERPSSVELRLKTDPHSLSFARTNEPLKHLPAFREAFACKATDPMVLPPEKHVKVW